jgi:cytochrome c biogenesis protein CcdA
VRNVKFTRLRIPAALCCAAVLLFSCVEVRGEGKSRDLYLFYSLTCGKCREARKYLEELRERYPQITFHELEIMKDRENQILFMDLIDDLDVRTPGVPVWIIGSDYLVGFRDTELFRKKVEGLIERQLMLKAPHRRETLERDIPSLPLFTIFVGLIDGVNPCALWVLMFLLTLLVNTVDRTRLLTVGITFVLVSALVYLLFMVAWLNLFTLFSYLKQITLVFAVVVIVIGLINLKELFLFKKGVSLTIPERVKPRLFRKMRGVANSPNLFLALAGTVSLAFFVNLVEFGCTVGLPAVYTKVLSDQRLGMTMRYGYLGLYCVAYMVPLLVVVLVFLLTFRRYRVQERHGRVLKLVSGALMLALGIILLTDPELLVF